ncbi:MAG TPA: M4 family metallopeptidase [Actinophytocola sp.]|uniref:M4 family metallopeptidase n=1 Tax=Actinophytocola sp. TaxID=1872138 RepID=UPI002DDD05F2|nr:M4 family metallopeptidase [Actinophytocola sp.]HEV2779311.1 M4 family metallopeptidase [Actinophytocola sp.]
MYRKRGFRASLALIAGLAVTVAVPAQPAQANQSPDVLAAQAADRAAAEGTALAKGPEDVFLRSSITPGGAGLFYAAYVRTYRGLEVIGGDAVIVTDGHGQVRDTVTTQTAPVAVDTRATLTKSAAEAIARAQLSTVERVVNRRLVVFAVDRPTLAYEVLLEGTRAQVPSRLHVFVDAHTGAVLDSWDDVMAGTGNGFYNGTVTINTQQSGGTFSTIDPTRPGVRCARASNQQVFTGSDDLWGNGSGTSLETACVDALYAEQREWDMLRTWLGRNGINGNGGGFPALVGLTIVNAFWNGSSASFGRSSDGQRQVVPIDVVAHEFGHGIFQFTPGGSGGGGNEKGGLNESAGDIFGALTEHFAANPNDPPDYQVGEEVNLVGNGPIRFMYNPSLRNHPNCFSSAIPNTEVHAAAGPQNHWFYLLAEGSNPGGGKPSSPTCNGSTVVGIGIQKAGQIFYNGLLRKTTTWTHARARVATLQAARALFPSGCTEFNAVRAAWNAVSVAAVAGEPTC